MVRWLLRRTIESFERKWNYDASYLKEIVDLSPCGRSEILPGNEPGKLPSRRAACGPVCGRDHRRAVRRLWPVYATGDHDG